MTYDGVRGLHDQYTEPQPRLLEVGRFVQVQYFTTNFSAKLYNLNYLLAHKTLATQITRPHICHMNC